MVRICHGPGDDPARLAGADQPDLFRVDAAARPQGIHRADGVGRQQVEVPVVSWTAFSLGLSSTSFVVGEEPNPGLGERADQVPIGQAVGLLASQDPDDGRMAGHRRSARMR
jgi:hypothetical protein